MIKFEDIAGFQDEDMRPVFERLTTSELAMALKTAPPSVTEKFLDNMHEHMADLLKRAMEDIKSPSQGQIEFARQRVLDVVRDIRSKS